MHTLFAYPADVHSASVKSYFSNTRLDNPAPCLSPDLSTLLLRHLSSLGGTSDAAFDDVKTMEVHFDSHANMVVLGALCWIISVSQERAAVSAFVDDVGQLPSVPIVDAVLAYDCPYTAKTILLVVRNALFIKSMQHHLIPPFILREAGLQVKEIPKQHCQDPTVSDHSIYLQKSQSSSPAKKKTKGYTNTVTPPSQRKTRTSYLSTQNS